MKMPIKIRQAMAKTTTVNVYERFPPLYSE
jgi:hypothetical protein